MRKALLTWAVALALTGTGSAFAWSAGNPPWPQPPSSSPAKESPGKSDKAPGQSKPGQDKPDKSQRRQHLHSESVVKKADGTFATELSQRGTVESVSGTAITVRSEDGYSQTYGVNAETRITQVAAPAAESQLAVPDGGKRLGHSEGTIADIAADDTVRVSGVKAGDQLTAERIVEGAGDGPGHGEGHGR